MKKTFIKTRLSALFFMLLFSTGALIPILSLYLKNTLHFTGIQTGIILSMSSLAAITSPALIFFIADKVISAEKLLGLLSIVGSLILFLFSIQTSFIPVLVLYTAYAMLIYPTVSLVTSITFHNTEAERGKFGQVRVWGTIGWIAVAWVLGLFFLGQGNFKNAIIVSAFSLILCAGFSYILPKRKIDDLKLEKIDLKKGFRPFLKKNIIVLITTCLVISVVDRFYYFGTSPFLKSIGFIEAKIMPYMSIGQFVEVFAMVLLAFFLAKIGFKKILLLGILSQILRFFIFSTTNSILPVTIGLSLHGLAYTFFVTAAYIYFDHECTKQNRTEAHQIFSFVYMGLGSLFGHTIAGMTMDFSEKKIHEVNYSLYWTVPMLLSIIAFIIILFFLKEKKAIAEK